ncbi:Lipoprotein [Fusobacterium sp. oral taxon C10]
MKKLAILALGVLSLVACTNQKVVKYNTARIDNVEDYLRNHKYVKPSENLDKLIEEGKIEYAEEFVPLEKEAKQWSKGQ